MSGFGEFHRMRQTVSWCETKSFVPRNAPFSVTKYFVPRRVKREKFGGRDVKILDNPVQIVRIGQFDFVPESA